MKIQNKKYITHIKWRHFFKWRHLYFIIKMECLNSNIIQLLSTTQNNKKFSQELRYKIREVILLNKLSMRWRCCRRDDG